MDIETVAEFVEDQAVLTVLKDIEVTYAQGYFLGKPAEFSTAIDAVEFKKAA